MTKARKTNVLLLLVGTAAIISGSLLTAVGRRQAARDTEPASAIIVALAEAESYDSVTETFETVSYPVVSYEAGGKTVQSQYTQPDSQSKYRIGDTVEIQYNPNAPEEFIIVGDTSFQNGAVWVIPAGIILFIIGLGKILVPLLRSKKQN